MIVTPRTVPARDLNPVQSEDYLVLFSQYTIQSVKKKLTRGSLSVVENAIYDA